MIAALALVAAGACGGAPRPEQLAAGGAVIHPAGCPAPDADPHDGGRDGTPVAEAQPPERTRTVAHHATGVRIDLPGSVRRIRRLVGGSDAVAAHTLEASGMRVELHSDGPLGLDAADLAELFAAPLRADAIGDPDLRRVVACYRDRVVGARELDGVRVRVLVPSDPAACLHRLALGTEAAAGEPCRSRGVTVPELTLSVGGAVRLHGSALVVATPAADRADPERAEEVLARVLLHELVHLYDNAMGLFPRPGELMAYEQRAEYVEASLMRWYGEPGRELPRPVRFPDPGAP